MMRRSVFLAGALALMFDLGVMRAQAPIDPWFTLTKIAPNVWAVLDNPGAKQRSYANAGFVIGDDGVIVIDTLTGDDAAGHMLKQIRKLTNLPIRFAVNTHYHGDHVAGNSLFADAGATVVAHRNVRTWIHSDNIRLLGDKPNPDLITFIKRFAPPAVTYTQAMDLHAGPQAIQVRYFPGHTGGDSVVIIPDAKVVFGGDLVWRNTIPNTIDGSTTAWIQTLDRLVRDFAGYTFVPGHGPLASSKDVTAFRDYLATVQKLVFDARATGKSGDAVVQTVLPALKTQYGSLELFEYLVPRNIAEAEAEQAGKKRIPQP